MIDLHSHTTASDGQHPPEVLVDMAAKAGVTTLAVTDHDTVASVEACTVAAKARGMRLVPGIEVSIMLNGREVHVLGHFVDPAEARLATFSENLRGEREKRMVAMVEKLRVLGFPITMQQVVDLAGPGAHLARPHLARVLMELNYVANTKEAFDRFLGDGKAASVPRFEVTGQQAIELIHGAGGTATVAHPGVSKIHEFELKGLAALGLDGLEVEHSDHPPTMREKLRGWADALSLISTAGSDFHGAEVAPNRHLGTASMKPEAFAALEARRP
ncbi:MAG: PHP domain-containing protein [Archangium sp.]|nr:PHP domain-containing protein [Archangium sp.]